MTWIKLHRQIQDSDIWCKRKEPFDCRSAWIDLLLLASHNERNIIIQNHSAKLHRGDLIVSIRFLMKRWRWGNGKTQAYLALLSELKMIAKIGTPIGTGPGTIYHITNYDTYQGRDEDSRYTNRYASGTPAVRQRYETKNYKKGKNYKEDRRISSSGSSGTTELGFLANFKKDCERRSVNPEREYERFVLECEKLGVNPWEEFERRQKG